MATIKKCTRCGNIGPHHHELDVICMECEMEVHYPNDNEMEMNVHLLQGLAHIEKYYNEQKARMGKI